MTHKDILYEANHPTGVVSMTPDTRLVDLPSRPLYYTPATHDNYRLWADVVSFGNSSTSEIKASTHKISGTITELSEPVSRVVRLYNHNGGALVATTESDANGAFEFGLSSASGLYYVVAFDDDEGRIFNCVIASKIAPVLIEE